MRGGGRGGTEDKGEENISVAGDINLGSGVHITFETAVGLPGKLLPRKEVLSRLFAVGKYPPECLRGVISELKDFTKFGGNESGGAGREMKRVAVTLQLLSAVSLGNGVRAI